jgi:hypothetical protein
VLAKHLTGGAAFNAIPRLLYCNMQIILRISANNRTYKGFSAIVQLLATSQVQPRLGEKASVSSDVGDEYMYSTRLVAREVLMCADGCYGAII